MKIAPIPEDENDRLIALQDLHILDTPPEERFDRITRLASRFFAVPIASINLIDTNRQWSKSCYGLAKFETSRDSSFCAHTILQSQVMIVSDTLEDDRFADSPLVTSDPHIRFYAGYPLTRKPSREHLGTLCILDRVPKQLSENDLQTLADLATWAEHELFSAEINKTLELLHATNQQLEESDRIKREFLYMMSHDFRTALTGIQGFSELIRDDDFSLSEIREYADDINSDAKRLNEMIEKLLESDRAAKPKSSH